MDDFPHPGSYLYPDSFRIHTGTREGCRELPFLLVTLQTPASQVLQHSPLITLDLPFHPRGPPFHSPPMGVPPSPPIFLPLSLWTLSPKTSLVTTYHWTVYPLTVRFSLFNKFEKYKK